MSLRRCVLNSFLKVAPFWDTSPRRINLCLGNYQKLNCCSSFLGANRSFSINESLQKENTIEKINATIDVEKTNGTGDEFIRVFKFPYIRQLAVFCRLKVYVTAISLALLPLELGSYLLGNTEFTSASVTISLTLFPSLSMLGMGELFRRTVGMIFISRDEELVKFAHLSFWGRRHDFIMPIDEIKMVCDTKESTKNIFWKIDFYAQEERSLLISTKFGGLENPKAFQKIFGRLP